MICNLDNGCRTMADNKKENVYHFMHNLERGDGSIMYLFFVHISYAFRTLKSFRQSRSGNVHCSENSFESFEIIGKQII